MTREARQSTTDILTAPTQRLDVLTSLRWWAAFFVFLYHMRVLAPLPGPVTRLLDQGYFGVTFFFVLSGFVLTWSMRPNVPTSTFYWRRFARIWPATMAALLFAIPVFYTWGVIAEGSFLKPFDLGILLLSVVLIQGWWANPVILFSGNPAAWTLTVEALFYALFPWFTTWVTKVRVRGALLVALGALVWAFGYRAGVTFWPEGWLGYVPLPLVRVPEFLLGIAIAWAIRCGWRPWSSAMIGLFAVGAVLFLISFTDVIPVAFGNEFFTLAVGIAIAVFATRTLRGHNSWFESRWQVKLGEWSFAFYLVHATVIYFALRVFGFQPHSWKNLIWFAAILAIDIALAWALHSFVERPIERRMRRWKDARDQKLKVRPVA